MLSLGEIATKHDIGIDFALFNDKLTGTIDYFHEQRDGIYQERNYIPLSVGMYGTGTGMKLSTNIGSVVSKDSTVMWDINNVLEM